MQIGVVFPQTELGGDPAAAREFALAVERLGYSHLVAYDHVLGADHADRDPKLWGPYTEDDPFHDPFVLFGYLAAVTPKLGFATDVLVLPQRQTALVAKQATDVQLLSGGRLRLGVGTGWNYVEYEALGMGFSDRGSRLDEQIDLLRRLWTERTVTFEGRFHTVTRASILPRPPAAIPIWVGGFSDPAFRRGARRGDGFLYAGGIDAALEGRARVQHFAQEIGRDLTSFGADFTANRATTTVAMAEQIDRWRDVGGTHFSVGTMRNGLGSLAAHVDYIADVAARAGITPRT